MAETRADIVRFAHYEKCSKRKRRIEFVLGIAMAAALVMAVSEIIGALFVSLLGGFSLILGLDYFFLTLVGAAVMAGAVYAIYKKDWRITAAVFILTIISVAIGAIKSIGALLPIPLTAALICDIFWYYLEQEEGFPLFQVAHDQQDAAEKAFEFTIRKNAVESGVRLAATEAGEEQDMQDLLDETAAPLNADVKGYQERGRNADPLTHASVRKSDVMDTLEDV